MSRKLEIAIRDGALKELIHGHAARPAHPMECLERIRSELLEVLRQTRDLRNSTSVVLVGHAGSGKTAILEGVLATLRADEDGSDGAPSTARSTPLAVVRLDGRIHTDDKMALKAATRQLSEQLRSIEAAARRRRAAAAAAMLGAELPAAAATTTTTATATGKNYETRRLKNIARNHVKMRELGLEASSPVVLAAPAPSPSPPPPHRERSHRGRNSPHTVTTSSKSSGATSSNATAGRGARRGDSIAHECVDFFVSFHKDSFPRLLSSNNAIYLSF